MYLILGDMNPYVQRFDTTLLVCPVTLKAHRASARLCTRLY